MNAKVKPEDTLIKLNELESTLEHKFDLAMQYISDFKVDLKKITCQKCEGTGSVRTSTEYCDTCPDCLGTGVAHD